MMMGSVKAATMAVSPNKEEARCHAHAKVQRAMTATCAARSVAPSHLSAAMPAIPPTTVPCTRLVPLRKEEPCCT